MAVNLSFFEEESKEKMIENHSLGSFNYLNS